VAGRPPLRAIILLTLQRLMRPQTKQSIGAGQLGLIKNQRVRLGSNDVAFPQVESQRADLPHDSHSSRQA